MKHHILFVAALTLTLAGIGPQRVVGKSRAMQSEIYSPLWLMDAAGADLRLLSSAAGSDNPNWSPDGGGILFDGYLNGWNRRSLLTIDRNGANEQIAVLGGTGWEGYSQDFTACDWINQGFVFMNGPLLMLYSGVGEYGFLGYGSIKNPDFQSLDLSPPTTSVDPLPAASPADVLVSWIGSATDGPAVEFQYEIHWRDGLSGAWTTVITAEHTAPDLRVDGESPDILAPLATYDTLIRYGNDGGGPVAEALITLTLPAGLSLVSAEPPPSLSGVSQVWRTPGLPGKTAMPGIALTLRVDPGVAGVTLTPTLVIVGASPELELDNNAWRAAIFVGYRAYLPALRAP